MKILVLADIHNDFEKLSKIMTVERGKFDAVIAPGDFTDMYEIPDGYTQLEMGEIILYRIIASKKPIFAIPGNHDPYGIIETFRDYGINIHTDIREIKGTPIMGWGGAMTPFDTRFEPSEEETEKYLNETHQKLKKKNFILVVHNPPFNTKLDIIEKDKHVGSKAVRKFIEKTQPIFTISAHIHESAGSDKIGKSEIFYPGAVFEGKYGIVDMAPTGKISFKIKSA